MSDIDNKHVPKLAQNILSRMTQYNHRHSILDDFEETFQSIQREKGLSKALVWCWKNVLQTAIKYITFLMFGGMIMFKNYIKTAFRVFFGHKLFSSINVFGLAIGLAVCMVISLWVYRELSYDRFHTKADRIYRIERELFRDNLYSRWPITGGKYKQALIDDFPEIVDATRMWRREFAITDYNTFIHRQEMYAVDNSFLQIFDFDLVEGDAGSALAEPKSVVLTRDHAMKYFGSEDVVGKALTFEFNGEPTGFMVTGILDEVPFNSHVKFDMLMSIATYPEDRFRGWRGNYLYTYVQVSEGTLRSELEPKLKTFVSNRLESSYGDLTGQGLDIHEVLKMHLFPISDIHLYPSENWEIEAGGSANSVYIFSSIALLILVIACINFMNLSTARASKRAREVSLRKTVGAGKHQLRGQFLQESVILAFASLIIAVVLCAVLIPIYQNVFGEVLPFAVLIQPKNILLIIAATIIVGCLAGLYPAFQLTRFDPIDLSKGGSPAIRGKSAFRRNMVIIQFAIAVTLIIGMFTVYQQMRYIQNRSLGFEKENIVLLSVRSQKVAEQFEVLKTELLNKPGILNVAGSSDIPGDSYFSNSGFFTQQNPEENINLISLMTDYDFVPTYKMDLLAGRNFSKSFSTDTAGTLLLNEAAVRRIGWTNDNAIDQELSYFGRFTGRVVGVVNDFNIRSLHNEVEPMAVILNPGNVRGISVRIAPGDVRQPIVNIRETWETLFPDEEFEFNFLDFRLDQLYAREQRMQTIFFIFSALAVFVACLGLLGLAAFTAEVRIKEIGIRKTLGASTGNVTFLLSKEFIKWILIANIVAWPVAYFMMSRWLQDFAYRAKLGIENFVLSAVLALLVAILTFSSQAIKAALANPVNSLKYE